MWLNLLFLLLYKIVIGLESRLLSPRFGLDWSLGPCTLQLHDSCLTNNQTIFYLYKEGGTQVPIVLDLNTRRVPRDYNQKLPLKVVIHGYAGGSTVDHTFRIAQEYLRRSGSNVLVVDWGKLANMPCYPTASLNTKQVGRCTGLAVAALTESPYIHAVGFSLGAHVAAYASNYLQLYTGRRFNRITGLDPALPFFATPKASIKLDASDADFVDVIHTNPGVFGKVEPTGHVDFYVNGVTIQPSCVDQQNPPLCSHMKAAFLFAESINSKVGFWGTPCYGFVQIALGLCEHTPDKKTVLMGEYVNHSDLGVYLVKTGLVYPFALGPFNSSRRGRTFRYRPTARNGVPQFPTYRSKTVQRYYL